MKVNRPELLSVESALMHGRPADRLERVGMLAKQRWDENEYVRASIAFTDGEIRREKLFDTLAELSDAIQVADDDQRLELQRKYEIFNAEYERLAEETS
jgi:hypothetical protein